MRLLDRAPGSIFRGARVLRSCSWIAVDQAEAPVVYVGGDLCGRWGRYHGESPDRPFVSGTDHRRAAVRGAIEHPELPDAQIFLGIDAGSRPGCRLAAAAGVAVAEPAPDCTGLDYCR